MSDKTAEICPGQVADAIVRMNQQHQARILRQLHYDVPFWDTIFVHFRLFEDPPGAPRIKRRKRKRRA